MLKKVLILGAFLIALGVATSARAQEEKEIKESTLTPRQILLLQIPADFSIQNRLGSAVWEVYHENGEPLEAITISEPPLITAYFTVGREPRGFVTFIDGFRLVPEGILIPIASASFGEDETADKAMTETVTKILEEFGILTDAQLAEFIKIRFTDKTTTSLQFF